MPKILLFHPWKNSLYIEKVCGEQRLLLSPRVSLFMNPRDSGIGNELDLELDEDFYENMDEDR